ncbi:hypothetical protein BHECKSOX_2357 [Bathymodiolus heckerae thiotrophic gill symbiont]|uniref:hypothetical protein n=1 Tax=Bathymodiolus heckerae thiotrophic gill symbiont TaxID=1052212 RepID=UPI0010B78F41|nr:hypothetical protein [Bathymodiolus heckerae thiotrophic gill symbiont]SHN93253.1 hypothetical protein BHECKSOX_2357 [Bathymodiolus heckerae thiotrophic gill symbiont]
MARYNLDEFKSLVNSSKLRFLNTRRTTSSLDKLEWSNEDLARMLCGMHSNDFQKTVPKCRINDCPGHEYEYVDADQYEIHWNEDTRTRSNHPNYPAVSLSLKIAIIITPDGQSAGLVTFHLSGSQY